MKVCGTCYLNVNTYWTYRYIIPVFFWLLYMFFFPYSTKYILLSLRSLCNPDY